MKTIVKNLGNFSAKVAKGLIGYSREKEGSTKIGNINLPEGDGYATKEGDILLGGFIQRRAAQEAAKNQQRLVELDIQAKENLAHKIWKEHVTQYGEVGNEHYRHWLNRVKSFSIKRNLSLPPQGQGESDHTYFRRLRKWTSEHPQKWPKILGAVGTHLAFSPHPEIWPHFRAAGGDERLFLRNVLTQTMREFSDWRRKQVGTGHSLGWVAGTHVQANGAERHPHIHLVVLKRDEAGKEVDWSVSSLKGRQGKQDPDPLLEIKRLFAKNVEKQLQHIIGKETVQSLTVNSPSSTFQEFVPNRSFAKRSTSPRLLSLGRKLRTVSFAMRSFRPLVPGALMGRRSEMGSMLRFAAMIRRNSRNKRPEIPFQSLREKILSLAGTKPHPKNHEPEL